MTNDDQDARNEAIEKHATNVVQLASEIATDARRQLAGYKSRMERVAAEIDGAAKRMREPTPAEKDLMVASAKVGASLTDVALDFAEAAFNAMEASSQDTRHRATDLVRRAVKMAVDETLQQTTNHAASRTTRMIELRTDKSWETIYLPKITGPKPQITVQLKGGEFTAALQVRTAQTKGETLASNADDKGKSKVKDKAKDKVTFDLVGSRPSLSIRLDPGAKLQGPQSGLILITGAVTLTLGLLAQAYVPPEANANRKS